MGGRHRQKDRLQSTAHHEAGHAVAASRQGMKLNFVTINPAPGFSGCAQINPFPRGFPPDVQLTPRQRERVEHYIIACYAGGLAQRRSTGRVTAWDTSQDRKNAAVIASYIAEGRSRKKFLDWLWIRADDFVSNDRNWAAITALAAALLRQQERRIGSREVKQIIFQALIQQPPHETLPSRPIP